MNIIYEGVDITDEVEIQGAEAGDYEGGRADDIRLNLANVEGLWERWGPKQGDTIRLTDGEYDSGLMYIDDIGHRIGSDTCSLGATSLNRMVRAESYQSWEGITLRKLIGDFAQRYDLTPSLHDVPDVTYKRIAQPGAYDLEWLSQRCKLESCALKLHDQKLVVYGQLEAEKNPPVRTIELTNNTPGEYRDLGHRLRSACVVESGSIRGRFDAPDGSGPVMYVRDVATNSIAEAQRFARGLLREQNKCAVTLPIQQELDGVYAAGECIEATGNVVAEGIWFVSYVRYDFIGEGIILGLRRPLPW